MDNDWAIVERKEGNVLVFLIKNSGVTSKLPDCAPGSTAYTASMNYMANKDLDGTWKQIGA